MSCEELHAKTIAELKKIATDMGINNIPELKADIIDTIYNASQNRPHTQSQNLDSLNVKQLKELAKQRGVPGYYKLTRPQLLSALAASSRPASPVRVATPPRPASPVRVPKPASPVQLETPPMLDEEIQPEIIKVKVQDREKYIDDILRDIQVNDTDKYLRTVSAKILRCLGMY